MSMRSFVGGSRVAAVAAAVLFLAGCAASGPDKNDLVKQQADALVGKPVASAFQAFGPPSSGMGPASYGTGGGFYNWSRTKISMGPGQTFVQTGTEYAGRQIVGMSQGGKGIAAMPIYQDNYWATGHYEQERVLHYLCDILVLTDRRNVITSVSVVGCR